MLLILSFLISQIGRSQNIVDTIYSKQFELFIQKAQQLITETHKALDSSSTQKSITFRRDTTELYAIQVQSALRKLDSLDKSVLSMATYFAKGKWPKSQDISSVLAQWQCSYFYYMNSLRKAGNNTQEIVSASVILDSHLQNGFPPTKYCPFAYAAVEIDFPTPPTKMAFQDSIKIMGSRSN